MDTDVLDVLHELGCFSASPIDETTESTAECDELDPVDDLWTDLGGEG